MGPPKMGPVKMGLKYGPKMTVFLKARASKVGEAKEAVRLVLMKLIYSFSNQPLGGVGTFRLGLR